MMELLAPEDALARIYQLVLLRAAEPLNDGEFAARVVEVLELAGLSLITTRDTPANDMGSRGPFDRIDD